MFKSGAQTGLKMGALFLATFVAMVLFSVFALLPTIALIAAGPVDPWTDMAVMIGNVVWFAVVVLPVFSGVMMAAKNRVSTESDDHYPVGAR